MQEGAMDCLADEPRFVHLEIPHGSSSHLLHHDRGSDRRRRRRRHLLSSTGCLPCRISFSTSPHCRSLCLGAIDGMLTGAGILSACVGLGLFARIDAAASSSYTMHDIGWMPVALTLAAALADGVCMALGHVWSTSLAISAEYAERREELDHLEADRSAAKARLVDALLLRGMLKIDAMSLADTLEGYPDLFVSALLGGGMTAGASGHDGSASFGMAQVVPGNGAYNRGGHEGHGGWDVPSHFHAGAQTAPDYGSTICDFHNDPVRRAVSNAVAESATEGIVMMLSFSASAVIPSLFYAFIPSAVNGLAVMDGSAPRDGTALLVLSLCLSAIVMFTLGAWKSHFYDASNWSIFGMKTGAVLVICASTAFSFGHAFRALT